MIVLVCGSRRLRGDAWYRRIYQRLSELRPVRVIHGGARGADEIAAAVARCLGAEVRAYVPEWDRHGKRAGPIRNALMLAENPDLVLAFHSDPTLGKGTADMVRQARRAGVPVELRVYPGEAIRREEAS